VAIVCAARRGLPVALHTPSEVKAAVTGSGRADKAQVTTMVMRLLRMTDPPRPADTADALALAICHLWRGATHDRLAAAGSRMEQRLAEARAGVADQLALARRERDQRLAAAAASAGRGGPPDAGPARPPGTDRPAGRPGGAR
jgi:crossover junction endodeoxyribonuclease RuvC